ncbi:MAG: flavodoxin [Candidatus Woesearchaeota archaeon]
MKTLVVYFTRTGTTKKLAEQIAEGLRADSEEIIAEKDYSGPLGYMRAGLESTRKKHAGIDKPKKDPSKYDLVIIGTPIWGWNISSPVRAYLEQMKTKLKKPNLAFFCTEGGSGGKKAFNAMESITGKNPKAVLELRMKDYLDGESGKDIKEFIISLK